VERGTEQSLFSSYERTRKKHRAGDKTYEVFLVEGSENARAGFLISRGAAKGRVGGGRVNPSRGGTYAACSGVFHFPSKKGESSGTVEQGGRRLGK